jgi:hypothetical protein
MVWRNFLDPLNLRKPYERTIYRKSKKEVKTTYLDKYIKMYPEKKFSIRKSKEMKPSSQYGQPYEVFYRKRVNK